jgi:hypothetical protein
MAHKRLQPGPRRTNRAPILSDAALRRFAVVGGAGVIGCVIARAPTILDKFTVPVLKVDLAANAGYVLVFGPLLLLAGVFWATYGASDHRLSHRHWEKLDWAFAGFLFVLPVLSITFLALQFFLLLAPKGECVTFDRLRYLTDPTLHAFQPEYCMSLPTETQGHLPWIIQPPVLWGWLQVLVPLLALALTAWGWRRWSRFGR